MRIFLWFLPSLFVTTPIFAEGIATDGSMGVAQVLTGSNVNIPQELGKTVGNNLFHSFSDFNINTGQTVTFSGSDSLQNVISRVTGNHPSVIDGILKSDVKNADFYFINPHGITFNTNAQVDVPAAFHVSTADKMDFCKNGGVFYADMSKDSQLSSEPPSAFGFLGSSTIDNGLVDINNAHLHLQNSKTFDVVSGEISIEGNGGVNYITGESLEPNVKSTVGDIRLVAFNGLGNVGLQLTDAGVLPLPSENSAEHGGAVSINGGYVNASGDGAERIAVYGGDVTITNGKLQADNIGNTLADENKGINIQTNNLYLNNGHISSSANNPTDDNSNPLFIAKGNAGNITISANNAVKLIGIPQNVDGGTYYNSSSIESNTSSDGNAGNVMIKAKDLELIGSEVRNKSFKAVEDIDKKLIANGNAGNINIDITDSIHITSTKELYYDYPPMSYISSFTNTNGHAGNVLINTKNMELQGGIVESSTSNYNLYDNYTLIGEIITHGDGGNVTLNVFDSIKLSSYIFKKSDGSNDYLYSNIGTNTSSNGNAGYTLVSAQNLEIQGSSFIGNYTNVNYSSDKERNHNALSITQGKVGDVTVNITDSLKMASDMVKKADGSDDYPLLSSISSDTGNNGDAGHVEVNAKSIDLQGGSISSSARNVENYDKDWNVVQTSIVEGNAGNVTIRAEGISMSGENTNISTATYTKGLAGKVDVNVDRMNVSNGASISSGSFGINSSGQTGNIDINGKDLNIESSGTITIKNEAVVKSNPQSIPVGTIDIHAKNIHIDDALITSESTGNVNAGHIHINYDDLLKLNNKAFINATSVDGNGGYVSISSPSGVLSLKNSHIATTATGLTSNGGNIDINSDIMVLNTGSLLASTVGGIGGNITLNLQSLVPSSNNFIEVGSQQFNWKPYSGLNVLGASGAIKSNVPQLNLSGVLANVTNTSTDNSLISQDYCAQGQGSSLSKKGRGALPMRPQNLQSF